MAVCPIQVEWAALGGQGGQEATERGAGVAAQVGGLAAVNASAAAGGVGAARAGGEWASAVGEGMVITARGECLGGGNKAHGEAAGACVALDGHRPHEFLSCVGGGGCLLAAFCGFAF